MTNQELTISQAIDLICQEKKISRELVLLAIEQALAAAYRRDYGDKTQNIRVEFNPVDGSMKAYDVKIVVDDLPPEELELMKKVKEETEKESKTKKIKKDNTEEIKKEKPAEEPILAEGETAEEKKRFNPKTEVQISDAKKINKKLKVGDELVTELPMPTGFGRVAAQTAKQVIVQKIREAERQTIHDRYKTLEGTVLSGMVQRFEKNNMVLIELPDGATALLPGSEQIIGEKYVAGGKFKFYLQVVRQTPKGPEIIVSRRHPEILKELLRQEVPEIANETVEIKGVVREAGSRAKVAVGTTEKGIDPVGACIGQRGVRIQTVISELGGEKIDIIEWNEDTKRFIANALSPAKVNSIEIDEIKKRAIVQVKEDQLSLVIGRAGQNVRLASRLTGYELEVRVETTVGETEAKPAESIEAMAEIKGATESKSESVQAVEASPEEAKVVQEETKPVEKKEKKEKKSKAKSSKSKSQGVKE